MADDWKIAFKKAFKAQETKEQAAAQALAVAQEQTKALNAAKSKAAQAEESAKNKALPQINNKKGDAVKTQALKNAWTEAQSQSKEASDKALESAKKVEVLRSERDAAAQAQKDLVLAQKRGEYSNTLKFLQRRLKEGAEAANEEPAKTAFAKGRVAFEAQLVALEKPYGDDDFTALAKGVAAAKTLLLGLLAPTAVHGRQAELVAQHKALDREPFKSNPAYAELGKRLVANAALIATQPEKAMLALEREIGPSLAQLEANGATPLTLDNGKKDLQLSWAKPPAQAYVDGGVVLGKAQLTAVLRPADGPALVYTPAAATKLGAGMHKLRVATQPHEDFNPAQAEVDYVVTKAIRAITWAPPAEVDCVVGGFVLTAAQLNAQSTPAGGTLVYDPPLTRPLTAGTHALKVSMVADDNHEAASAQVSIKVRKAPAKITWKEPAAVLASESANKFKLTSTQLNAVLDAGDSPLVYTPAANAMLGVGTVLLTVSHAESADYAYADKSVRLKINRNAQEQAGYTDLRGGGGFATPIDAAIQGKWDAKDSKLKTESKRLMADMQDMTGDELVAYMTKQVKSGNHKSQGGDYPNDIWKLPNGLQVRYKPKGDRHSNPTGATPVPMFCIEILAPGCTGFSASQADIASKISVDGELAPKGPGDTTINGGNATEKADYTSGSASATHLGCRQAKIDQQIVCRDAIEVPHGTPLSAALFDARLQPGNGLITTTPAAGTVLPVGDSQSVTLGAAATARFKLATKVVKISVKKAAPTLAWAAPKGVICPEAGCVLSATQLNATVSPPTAGPLTYLPALGTLLKAGDHELTVSTKASATHEAATTKVVFKVAKAEPTIDWPLPDPCEAGVDGVVLSEAQLNAVVSPSHAQVSYTPALGDRLGIGTHELTVNVKGTDTMEAATAKVSFKVRLQTL